MTSAVWMKIDAWVKWVFSLVGLSYEMFWPGNLELGHRDDRELVGGTGSGKQYEEALR